MKLEHHKQKVVPFPMFLMRMSRYAAFSLVLIIISVFAGSLGYHHYGQLNWLDSFHMSCMILTGMGPVELMKTDSAKLFSSFFALYSGVAFLSITAVFFAPIVHRILHILHVDSNEEMADK